MFIADGFWGLRLLPKKTYTQVVETAFRITMAALGPDVKNDKKRISVVVSTGDQEFTLCNLIPGVIEQQTVDITLTEGDEITFATQGECTVDLLGNFVVNAMEGDEFGDLGGMESEEEDEELEGLEDVEDDVDSLDDEDMLDGDEEMDSEEEEEIVKELKRRAEQAEKANKKIKTQQGEAKPVKAEKEKPQQKKPEQVKKTEQPKKAEQAQPKKENKKPQESPQKPEEPIKKPEAKKQESAETKTLKKTLPNGLMIEDIVVGKGPKAKKGKKIAARYIGKLMNGKVFDSNTKGKPFAFKLGAGHVIKGWDMGFEGMNVGGTRKLTIPASLAYGASGAPPDIPPNSTLQFEVKLLDVKN